MAPGGPGWRWGCELSASYVSIQVPNNKTDGMFAILVPVTIIPLIVVLGWAQHKAKVQGLIEPRTGPAQRSYQKASSVFGEIDIFGLFILAGGVACVLLPLTLAATAKGGWSNRTWMYALAWTEHY